MSGLGKQSKIKKEKTAVDKTVPPPPSVAAAEGPTTEETVAFPTFCVIEGHEAQVVQREVRLDQSGQLVEFAIMLQMRPEGDDAWMEVERVDCAHGEVHVDQTGKDGVVVKNHAIVPPACRSDLDKALKWACDYIWDIEERTVTWA